MIKSTALAITALIVHVLGIFALTRRIEPFMYDFYIISWWSYIFFLDAVLSFKLRAFLVVNSRLPYLALVSCAFWCVFELINLRLGNWFYINIPDRQYYQYLGYLVAFGTVVPGVYITKEAVHRIIGDVRICPILLRNHLSVLFFSGFLMLILAIVLPQFLFALAWVFLIPIMDVLNYKAGRTSFIGDMEEGKAGGLISTILGGMICGFLWELWNYRAISKWVYTVPWFEDIKLFEMPVLGYLGFAFFAIETIAFFNFFNEGKFFRSHACLAALVAVILSWSTLPLIERYTVFSHLAKIDQIGFISETKRAYLKKQGVRSSYAVDTSILDPEEKDLLDLMELKGLGLQHTLQLRERGINNRAGLASLSPAGLCAVIHEPQIRRCRVYIRAAGNLSPIY